MIQSPNDGTLMMLLTIAGAGEAYQKARKIAKKNFDVPNKFGTFFLKKGL
jgi:Tfp pilus assembly protein PilF